jgi:DNA/RNA endonuclease G (NUC1)
MSTSFKSLQSGKNRSKSRSKPSSRRTFPVYLAILAVLAVSAIFALTQRSSALTNNGSITSFGSAMTESFDSLASTGTNIAWADNTTIPGWYSSRTTYNSGNGNSTTGALYSFGSSPVTDRALGSVGSGATTTVYWAAKFTNNTGGTITSLDVSYIGEQWRNGGATSPAVSVAQTLDFQYQIANTGVITGANAPTTGWVDVDTLDFTSPTFGTTAAATLDGNAAANRLSKSGNIPLTIAAGQEVWLRWRDIDHAGNDHGLAVDDLSVTANGAGPTNPSGVGTATPSSVFPTGTSLLTVAVTPGANPTSTAHTVTADLTSIGGSATQTFFDNGTNGDVTPNDNTFSYNATVANATTGGAKSLPFTITETAPQSRTGSGSISLTVLASTNPSGTGAANPATVEAGANSVLTVTVTPGTNPTSSGITVTGDLSSIGGSASQQFFDDGSHGDVTPNNNVFTFDATVAPATTLGAKTLPIQIADAQSRTASTSISLTVAAAAPAAGSVVISQAYGGGGNAGATIKQDFIELINHSANTINLSGWSVQFASANQVNWNVTALPNFNLAPGQYFLIQQSQGAGGSVDLVPDLVGTALMGATSGKMVLLSNTTPLTTQCPSGAGVIDVLGYGTTATCFEGTGPAAAPSNTTAVLRKNSGCLDTDNNASDFEVGTPNPRNSSAPTNNCAVLSGIGSSNPFGVQAGDSSTLSVQVSPASNPTSSGITVTADLSAIGGPAAQPFSGVGNTFSFVATVSVSTTPGLKNLPATISDAQGRTAIATIPLLIQAPHVTISQVYGGGGNAGATFNRDYVELYNPSGVTFDLTGWSIQYASATGDGWEFTRQPIGGTIAPGQYYLVALASGGPTGADLPAANVVGDINMSGTAGKITLVNNFDALEGSCPLSDVNLVDFVGYGSTANCSETAVAPAPSNTTAIFRQNNGQTDTDNNAADFFAAAPNPRRTAPIVELGPSVFSTDPRNNGFNAPRDATMTINFTEPVDVVGSWFNISCATTGLHNDATVAGSGKTYTITPNVNFLAGEQCTVTILKDQVHDTDTDDSGPNADTLSADYVFTFSVATGTAPPYPPTVHLAMGNPNGATTNINEPNNYLMEKPEFALSYNRDHGGPNWVSWHLADEWVGTLTRVDTFRADPQVPPTWYRVQGTDFSGSGFDRGHMVPNADRDKETSTPINQATFLMSNMIAQSPDNNQGPWADFENYLRTLLPTNELYIVAGPSGAGGTGSNGSATTIAGGHVLVPSSTWKVVLVIPKGENDVTRVTAASRTIAIEIPNVQGIRTNQWEQYITTVDAVEDLTGYDFFGNVPDAIENSIEAGTNGTNPPGTANQVATTAEDNSVSITLNAVSPLSSPTFSYTIVSSPTHGSLSGSGPSVSYTPALNYNGPDSFTFKVNDGSQNSNTSTVSITVTEVNDAPAASDDSASTNQDTPLNIPAGHLTTNDSAGPANEGSQTLTVTNVTATADTHGSVSLSSGVVTYTPAASYNGAASFTYQVCDNGTTNGTLDSKCATGTVNVTVNATAPALSGNGATISQESCPAFNNAVDPGERVSVNLKLINNGSAATSNLVGTLQASANVIAPTGPMTYGSIAGSGGTAGRDFSFTAVGNCGDFITLSLKLQDGATDRGTVTYSFQLGGGGPCTATCGGANVVVTTTLARQNSTTVVASISIQNIGSVAANNVVLNNAKLGATNGTPLPQSAGNLAPGATFNTTANFTNSTPGASSNLVVGGTYTGGSFSTTKRVTIP